MFGCVVQNDGSNRANVQMDWGRLLRLSPTTWGTGNQKSAGANGVTKSDWYPEAAAPPLFRRRAYLICTLARSLRSTN